MAGFSGMFDFLSKNKKTGKKENGESSPGEKQKPPSERGGEGFLTKDLEKNIAQFKELFQNDDTFVVRRFQSRSDPEAKYCLLYSESVVNSDMINDDILKPVMLAKIETAGGSRLDTLLGRVVQINQAEKSEDMTKIIESVTYGDTLLLADGEAATLILSSKNFVTRSSTEPSSEQVLSGPREGFSETLMGNLSMVRRRVRSNHLKMRFYTFGRRTKTKACICYLDNLANEDILNELYQRLDRIDIDGMLDTNYINELIGDSPWSPFRTTGYTERPDVVVGKMLEGRIAIFLDGTPVVLTIPYLFIENFQSNEDYYTNFYYASLTRILRIVSFLLTISVPAFYIGIMAFHHEMLPVQLMISITSERQKVPFPAALEAFLMLIVFDILRETGIRMPSNVGQALSIVGALVVGQAAVEASLVAAPMIIVIALTAITGLVIPRLKTPIMFIRFFLLGLATAFGFFGFSVGMAIVLVHMINLNSFGISQLFPVDMLRLNETQDVFIRAPFWKLRRRNAFIAKDTTRMKAIRPAGDAEKGQGRDCY